MTSHGFPVVPSHHKSESPHHRSWRQEQLGLDRAPVTAVTTEHPISLLRLSALSLISLGYPPP